MYVSAEQFCKNENSDFMQINYHLKINKFWSHIVLKT